jgi:hypothetical protein
VATFESQGSYSAAFSAHGTIPEGIAANIPNGLYVEHLSPAQAALANQVTISFFRMTSTKEVGGVLINYSNRFSILGLTGDTALRIRQAALALNGDTDGPPAVGNDASSTTTNTASTTSSVTSSTASSSTGSPTIVDVSTTTHFTSIEASESASAELTESIVDDNASSGLSKGAAAGIAVAVTIAVIAVCAGLGWFLYIRHRKKQNEVHEIAPGTIFHHKPMSELSAEELVSPKKFQTYTSELSSESMVYEAGSGERPPELDHMAFRAELEGSQPTTPK